VASGCCSAVLSATNELHSFVGAIMIVMVPSHFDLAACCFCPWGTRSSAVLVPHHHQLPTVNAWLPQAVPPSLRPWQRRSQSATRSFASS
jgi:hypothetical protein